ncbi:aminoglycoside phosphotransferase family protein [Streptomyces sp. NPDC048606]|uniref:aminoglycoside phosphotransferase family protein n=1 Tax=Streptomyces sp. NPDC048606 TaxID=3154726 RepID=UPI003434B64F
MAVNVGAGVVEECVERWGLRVTGAGMRGMTAVVWPVVRGDGSAAALKVLTPDEETVGEPLALRAWGGRGSVRLLEYDAGSGSMLLERLDERRPLSRLARRDPRGAVRVLGELLSRLGGVRAPAGLRGLGGIAEGMLAEVPGAVGRLASAGDRRVVRECAAVLAEVVGEPGDRLLHWDLHFGNVLAGVREPWLAIDPKPLSGDPGFELLPSLVNEYRERDVRWRFDLLSEAVGVDRARARAWTLGRVLQNCLWEVEEGCRRLPRREVAVAGVLLGRGFGG